MRIRSTIAAVSQCIALFVRVGMAVISPFNAGNDVAKHALGNVRPNACADHQGLCRAAQIVKRPIRQGLDLLPLSSPVFFMGEYGLIERSLALGEAREWRLGARCKYVIAAIELRLRLNNGECRLDNGTWFGRLVLYRSAGIVQIPSSPISLWLIWATSSRRCAVSKSILTKAPKVPASLRTGQMTRISSSDRTRVRARSFGLALGLTRTKMRSD